MDTSKILEAELWLAKNDAQTEKFLRKVEDFREFSDLAQKSLHNPVVFLVMYSNGWNPQCDVPVLIIQEQSAFL